MPWSTQSVSELRLAFVHQVITSKMSVSQACREFGISRKTGYKWLDRYRKNTDQPLQNQSRRPRCSPQVTSTDIEQQVLQVRDQFGWGPRKIHAYLTNELKVESLPSVRTLATILRRNGRVEKARAKLDEPLQFFERSAPHELWQCDHKGPLEVGRRELRPFVVIDDHSRYLIAIEASISVCMAPAFDVLWNAFGEFGMPKSILCDNAFGTTFQVPKTISWFEARLIRLDIDPIHGRPYHPQTQGKVERFNGTLEREVWPHVRRDTIEHFDEDVKRWRHDVYNTIRPHEALGDEPPISRFRLSPRPRPARLEPVEYPEGSIVRKVSTSGDVRYSGYRILAGRGIVGERVRIEQRDHEVVLFYAHKEIRALKTSEMKRGKML